ncbi:MAG: MFS transporter [Candidatus Bathyarchaeota archaeon]|nr:MAG: MFS transporter [Candidatus Bathyarchaeota archaeon]
MSAGEWMKRVAAVTFLNYFVTGGLALTIPLLLLERNVDLAEIGLVLSVLPLVFLFVRLFFAALADNLGWAPFFILLNWPGTFFSTVIYFLANSTFAFLMGKIVEAVKESSYWAVNRTAIFSLSSEQKGKATTRISAVISLSFAIGSAVSGLVITFMGFSFALGILILASSIMGIPAALLWRTEESAHVKPKILSAIALLDPRGRSRTFWLVSFAMLFYSLALYPLGALLLPVFMAQQLGYSYILIGIAFMLYNLISFSVAICTLRIPLGVGRVSIQSLIALFATVPLANSSVYFPALFLLLAVANGLGLGFFESIIAKATENRETVSVDIGLLHIPVRLAEFSSVLGAGFVAQSLGYFPVFVASGSFFAAFSVLSLYVLRRKKVI